MGVGKIQQYISLIHSAHVHQVFLLTASQAVTAPSLLHLLMLRPTVTQLLLQEVIGTEYQRPTATVTRLQARWSRLMWNE